MGLSFDVVVPRVEEVLWRGDARGTVAHNALLKNRWCRRRFGDHVIISADTIIDFGGECITKPGSMPEARAMLMGFSGLPQTVLTGVAFSEPAGEPEVEVVASRVVFRNLAEADVDRYVDLVDPLDKAGGYDIDQHAELIIDSFAGSRTNIMGLPAENVAAWLQRRAAPPPGGEGALP
jgi:septum formation protein